MSGSVALNDSDFNIPNDLTFSHVRSYGSQASTDYDGPNGYNWYLWQVPYVVASGTAVAIVFDVNNPLWFDKSGGSYVARYGQTGVTLVEDTTAKTFTVAVSSGTAATTTAFNSFSALTNPGQFVSQTDSRGITTTIYAQTGTRVDELRRSYTISGVTTTEALVYSYFTSGTAYNKIQTITYRRKVGAGSWIDLQQVTYAYYGSSDTQGSTNDLKSASQALPNGSGGWNTIGVMFYRYYKTGASLGFAHALKMRFGPEAYRQVFNAGIAIDSASDATLLPYADHYFEYNPSTKAATKEISQVCESCVGGGTSTDLFTYTSNPHGAPGSTNYNYWMTKCEQTLPDSSKIITYTNAYGMPMLKVNVDPSGSNKWCTFYLYDSDGRLIWEAQPSAVNGYNDTYDDLMHFTSGAYAYLNTSTGLIKVTSYYTSGAVGYVQYQNVRQGQSGSDIRVRSYTYTSNTDSGGTTVYPVATVVDYPDATTTATTITTSYSYTFYSGTNQLSQKLTTLPSIASGQNGSGSSATITENYDTYGNLASRTDERGTVNTYTYDIILGVMTQRALDTGGVNQVTTFTYDDQARLVQTLGPSHTVVLSGTATSVQKATWNVYLPSAKPGSGTWDLDQVVSGQGYVTSGPTYTMINPVSVSQSDKNGRSVNQITTTGTGALYPSYTFSFSQSDWLTWTSMQSSSTGQSSSMRVYHLIPSSGSGSVTTNYGQTTYGYDALERKNRVVSAGGTITRTVWTTPQRVASTWIGTNDTGATDSNPAGSGSPNNMVKVGENQYDGGGIGDGNVTQVTQYVSSTSGDTRVTAYGYDFRDRRTSMDGEVDVYEIYTYDNLDRMTQTDRKNTTNGGNLIGRSQTLYDDRSHVYQQITYAVDPSTGTVGNALTTNNWYDAGGMLIKSIQAGGGIVYSKTAYNGMGWPTASYSGYNTTNNWTTANSLSGDTILEQAEKTYDVAGNPLSTTSYQRLNDATGTGALSAGTQPKARLSYTARWFDGIDRTIASANYGAAASFSRPTTPPSPSDTVLVTSITYNSASQVYQITDPAGLVNQTTYDNAGRTTRTIASVSGSTGDDLNQTINYTYTLDNKVATLQAINGRTGNQTTTYTYGTTLSDSGVASNLLLRYTDYPDSVSGSDRVAMTYNRLSQVTTRTDQRGTVRSLNYDKLGRVTDDRVTTNGTGTDVTVKRISSTYEVRGMLATLTSYDNATVGSGTALNQVKFTYNTFSQLTKEEQEHAGAVSSSPSVQYGYATGGSSSNQVRPITLTYPDGRQIDFDYGTSGGTNDSLNRLSAIIEHSTSVSLAAYTYLGARFVVRIDYAQPGVRLDLWGGTSGTFSGIDLFGRVIDQRWVTTGGSPTDLDRYKYGYDRDSNRFYKQNTVGSGLDEFYTYDNLNRLASMQRGTLTGGPPFTGISGTPARELDYTLDPTGNWRTYLTKTTGTTDLNQSRTANTVNEITGITESTGPSWIDPAYDAAGNTTTLPSGLNPTVQFTASYDAWNRLTKIVDAASSNTVAEYQYDGKVRRIVKKTYTSGTLTETRHFYWSNNWQDLEERVGAAASADRQQVWGARYVDELVCRDDATPQRIYACQDANFNVTALVSTSATVLQRFIYEPYGQPTVLNASWASTTDAYSWVWRHQGLAWDGETGMYYNRLRYLQAGLGRFLQRDPSEEMSYPNLYQCYDSSPLMSVDPDGLAPVGTNSFAVDCFFCDPSFFPLWVPWASGHCDCSCTVWAGKIAGLVVSNGSVKALMIVALPGCCEASCALFAKGATAALAKAEVELCLEIELGISFGAGAVVSCWC